MDEKHFYRRWKRQYVRGLKAVTKQLRRCRETGDAEAVHELRVVIRRSRLLALMGRSIIGRDRAMAYRTWTQRVANALSPVRDYDVMIEWALQVCKDAEFVRALQKDRTQAWRDARKALKGKPPTDWKDLRPAKVGRKKRHALASRYKKISKATRDVIEMEAAFFDRLDPNARHDFRRAVRRLKYLHELDKTERAEDLGKLQLELGELQNVQTMTDALRKGRRRSRRRKELIRDVKRNERKWLIRCRRSLKRVVHHK